MKFDRKSAKKLFLHLASSEQDDILVDCGFDEFTLKAITLKHFQNWSFEEVVEILYNVSRNKANFDNYIDRYKRLKRKAFSRIADIMNGKDNKYYSHIFARMFSGQGPY